LGLYCIVSIHLYSAFCSAHQSEALQVRETKREENQREKRGVYECLTFTAYLATQMRYLFVRSSGPFVDKSVAFLDCTLQRTSSKDTSALYIFAAHRLRHYYYAQKSLAIIMRTLFAPRARYPIYM